MTGQRKPDAWHFDAIKAKTIQQGDCWIWQGWKTHNGYGEKNFRGKTMRVHRIVYTIVNGPVSSDLDVCHSCDNRLCCNPAHLWVGTRKQNMEDCLAKARHDSQKRTHCPRGHEYNEENTYKTNGSRDRPAGARNCRACQRIRQRLRAGWPPELAENLDVVTKGERPVKASWKRIGSRETASNG